MTEGMGGAVWRVAGEISQHVPHRVRGGFRVMGCTFRGTSQFFLSCGPDGPLPSQPLVASLHSTVTTGWTKIQRLVLPGLVHSGLYLMQD